MVSNYNSIIRDVLRAQSGIRKHCVLYIKKTPFGIKSTCKGYDIHAICKI